MTTNVSQRDADLAVLEAAIRVDLGDPAMWPAPDGYRESLALCVIDAIYSMGAHFESSASVVDRYVDYRRQAGADVYADGLQELLLTFEQLGGEENWADTIGIRRMTANGAGPAIRAQAVHRVAQEFVARNVSTTDDLRLAILHGRGPELKREWCAVPAQWSGVTWNFALKLAGIPGIKADPTITRHVAKALGCPVSPEYATRLLLRLAIRAEWDLVAFDDRIWQFESVRV
ncbi:heme peroxidase [Gordonia sp. NPDC003424]